MSDIDAMLMERLRAYPWAKGMEIPLPVVRELESEQVLADLAVRRGGAGRPRTRSVA